MMATKTKETWTISFDPKNKHAQALFQVICLSQQFTVEKILNNDVNGKMMSDIKGALREVKDSMDGKLQMKDAYELLNEL